MSSLSTTTLFSSKSGSSSRERPLAIGIVLVIPKAQRILLGLLVL